MLIFSPKWILWKTRGTLRSQWCLHYRNKFFFVPCLRGPVFYNGWYRLFCSFSYLNPEPQTLLAELNERMAPQFRKLNKSLIDVVSFKYLWFTFCIYSTYIMWMSSMFLVSTVTVAFASSCKLWAFIYLLWIWWLPLRSSRFYNLICYFTSL